jgi:dihydropteroate synthase
VSPPGPAPSASLWTEELRRVGPVVTELVVKAGVPVSIDTMRAPVAEFALNAGASWSTT